MNGKTVKQIKDLDNLFKRDFHDDISIIVSPLSYYHWSFATNNTGYDSILDYSFLYFSINTLPSA